MPDNKKNAGKLVDALDLPITVSYKSDGEVELFVHTDPRSLDPSLSSLERSCAQALELHEHYMRKQKR